MKKVRRSITAADAVEDDRFKELMNSLKDDFDYIMSGLDKLDRMGSSDSLAIGEELSGTFQAVVSEIADKL